MAFYPSSEKGINGIEVLHGTTGYIPTDTNIDNLKGKYACGWMNGYFNYPGTLPFSNVHYMLFVFGTAQFAVSRGNTIKFRSYDTSTGKWTAWS